MSQPGALVRHPLAIAGVFITAIAGVVFIALLIAALIGLFDNHYAGLVVFVAVPAVFVLGMLLVPLGMWLQRRKLARLEAAQHVRLRRSASRNSAGPQRVGLPSPRSPA